MAKPLLIDLEGDFSSFENLPRLLFLTVKGPIDHRSQKIGYVNNMLRKVSDRFIIIREHNSLNAGYHYHALVSLKKDLKPNWFRKGVHIHITAVGNKMDLDRLPSTSEEAWDVKYSENDDLIDRAIINNTLRLKAKIAAKRCKIKKRSNVTNIMNYMLKEQNSLKMYESYIVHRAPKQ